MIGAILPRRRTAAHAALSAATLVVVMLAPPASGQVAMTSGSGSSASESALCIDEHAEHAVHAAQDQVDASARLAGETATDEPGSVAPLTLSDVVENPDTPVVTQEAREAVAPERPQAAARAAARSMTDRVSIPVHVTLVRGNHKRDINRNPAAVRSWIRLLNNAYAGGQSAESAPSRYTFALKSVRQVRNDRWYHAVGSSRADNQMRRKLHRGGAGTLNLYVTGPGNGNDILGFARFPWQQAGAPKLDGVTVNVNAMPGGRVKRYNEGDTLVHEVGHWMGLFHTFQGGCGDPANPTTTGDQVEDTPAEAQPHLACDTTKASCEAGKLAPVRNFMNYSWDSCMNQFTRGQVGRMDQAFAKFRYGR